MAKVFTYDGLVELVAQIKSYVSAQIAGFDHAIFKVVETLPDVADAASDKIYIVPDTESTESQNVYDEWYLVNGAFEKLGSFKADVDLSGYVKEVKVESDYATVDTVDGVVTLTISIPEATTEDAGLMSAEDKAKLDSINADTVVNTDDLSEYAKTETLEAYVKSDDLEEISTEEVDALFE